ncbi:hypothetical protein [Streptomyces iakyrus]|uniref:hypothetical protein n=1 Tax=Streptomyces iakyrus TaxID=68219 RepID=UPI003D93D9CA
MFFDYYRTKRGYHPRSINSTTAWTGTTPMSPRQAGTHRPVVDTLGLPVMIAVNVCPSTPKHT